MPIFKDGFGDRPGGEGMGSAEKIRILLVEYYTVMRGLIRAGLVHEGYDVTAVGDFEMLKVVLGAVTPDLAIVDFRFPRRVRGAAVDLGFEAQELLRRIGVPTIGMSLGEHRPLDHDLGEFGDEFVCKTADDFLGVLLDAVQRLLEGEVVGGK